VDHDNGGRHRPPTRLPPACTRPGHASLLVLLILFSATFATQVRAAQTLRVGIYQNEPKIFTNAQGQPDGFFVELLDAVAAAEGWTLHYVPCTWDACLRQLEQGELDLMPDVADTPQRRQRFELGDAAVFASWSVIYARPGSGIKSLLDLHGKKVAVLRDSMQARTLARLTENFDVSPQFLQVSSFDEGYQLIEQGAAEAIAVNHLFGRQREARYSARPTNILLAPTLIKFAAPRKHGRALLERIDRHILALKSDKSSAYYRAYRRWFEAAGPFALPGWLKWSLIGTGVIIIGLLLITLLLRRVVRRKTQQLQHLSYFDTLTRLPNRMLFMDRLQQAASRIRQGAPHLAVLFIDLDDFKRINDSFGHEIGDQVLSQVGKRFAAVMRKEDTVARLGGDEFTVLIQSFEIGEQAAIVAQKLLDTLHQPFQISVHTFYVSASVGISLMPQDGTEVRELLRNADAAMYRAKEEGQGRFCFYSPEMTEQAIERMALIDGLRQALNHDELLLHYQPLFRLHDRALVGVEALLRWQHPTRGMVPPASFIPLAEESGCIHALGEHVLRSACRQMVQWRRDAAIPERIAINISVKQLQQEGFVATLTQILEHSACRPEWIELEITESSIMSAPERCISVLQELRDKGIGLSIDDFGTGHSSLTYLKRLPISRIKIDRSFVRDIPGDSNDVEITKAIIALSKSLDLKVLAEGIETDEQYRLLQQEGCDEGQGYLLGRPVAAHAIGELLASGRGAAAGQAATQDIV